MHIASADGARASIALDGGHVMSWTPAGETDDRLFVSARSRFGAGEAIRGGIPVVFPQFGPFGDLPQHGFARRCRWTIEDVSGPTLSAVGRLRLRLNEDATTQAQWPHAFVAKLIVGVTANSLTVALTVKNTDAAPFSFTAAFHPYFAVRDAFATRVEGLAGCRVRDSLHDGLVTEETASVLDIVGPLDRIYYDAPDRLFIRDGDRSMAIEKVGFPDAVVWNPGAEGVRARTDFAEGEERLMLCVEAAVIQQPITLVPGESWTGLQIMRAS